MTFPARYSGRCASCDDRIHEGDLVRYGDDQLVHNDCPDPVNPDAPGRQERNCPDCFQIHAGGCF